MREGEEWAGGGGEGEEGLGRSPQGCPGWRVGEKAGRAAGGDGEGEEEGGERRHDEEDEEEKRGRRRREQKGKENDFRS